MSPKQEYKEWAMHLKKMVPGEFKVSRFYDETEENSLDIFESTNSECILVSTIGVMEVEQKKSPNGPVFTEIIMDSRGNSECISNVL